MGHKPQGTGRVGLSRAINKRPQAKILILQLPTPTTDTRFEEAEGSNETQTRKIICGWHTKKRAKFVLPKRKSKAKFIPFT
jgi:hypothetical protein